MYIASFIRTNKEGRVIEVIAPGQKKKDFTLEVQEGKLLIYLGEELRDRFWLSENVKTEEISAKYDAGILYITLPRQKPTEIKIE